MPMAMELEDAGIAVQPQVEAVDLESREAVNMPRPPSQTDLTQMVEVSAFSSRLSNAAGEWNCLKDDPKTTMKCFQEDRDIEHSALGGPLSKTGHFSKRDVATSNGRTRNGWSSRCAKVDES